MTKIDNLPGSVLSKPSRPFVKVRLHPELQTFETNHVNFSHNPIFNETFSFPVCERFVILAKSQGSIILNMMIITMDSNNNNSDEDDDNGGDNSNN